MSRMSALDEFCHRTGLDHSVVAGLGDLDDDHYAGLAAAYEHAARRRSRELRAASENALGVIPRLLRPAVRALFS